MRPHFAVGLPFVESGCSLMWVWFVQTDNIKNGCDAKNFIEKIVELEFNELISGHQEIFVLYLAVRAHKELQFYAGGCHEQNDVVVDMYGAVCLLRL